MKTKTMMVALATLLIGSLCFWACQKDEPISGKTDATEHIELKTGHDEPDCNTHCINPDEEVYFEKTDQQIISWGGRHNDQFSKTVDIVYYNTLDAFILMVKSSENIANLLVDDISVKEFSIPLPAGTWYELSFPLAYGWEVCDDFNFQFSVIGNGPPALFEVEYQLVGECVYYTLELAVNPEGAGTVTGAGKYMEGEEVALTATENEGWEFVNWTDGDNTEISGLAEFTYTMPAVDVMLAANFQEETVYPIYGDGVTDIDGNEYITVIIGNQEWMAENLRVTKYNNGVEITTNLNDADWLGTTEGAYAIYPHGSIDGLGSDAEVVSAYGKLYNWHAATDSRGLCPVGWSVPIDDDWTQLVDYVVSQGFPNTGVGGAGSALKSCRQIDSPLGGACNTFEHPRWGLPTEYGDYHYGFDEFGFSALPGGGRWSDGRFSSVGILGHWWSVTELSGSSARSRTINKNYGNVYLGDMYKVTGFSVRCVKD